MRCENVDKTNGDVSGLPSGDAGFHGIVLGLAVHMLLLGHVRITQPLALLPV